MSVYEDPRTRPAQEKMVSLSKIQITRSTQARKKLNPDHVKRLMEDVLDRGKDFEDPVELYDDGFKYWIGDGFHRLDAYERKGREKARALVRKGTERDAMIHAAGANDAHGLLRSREDRQRAIGLLLDDKEFARKSNRTIAKLVRCDDKTVAAEKRRRGIDSDTCDYTDKHGNETVMDVSHHKRPSKKSFCFGDGKTNAFHDLPEAVRQLVKQLLQELGQLPRDQYSFVRTWLEKLPPTPKEAAKLLTELDLEEMSEEPEDDIRF